MTRSQADGRVRLEVSDILKVVGTVCGAAAIVVGATWKFSLDTNGELREMKADVRAIERRLDRLETK